MSKKEHGVEGSNSGESVAGAELRSFFERIEKLTDDKQEIADDIKDVFAELSGRGFNAKAVREILRRRKMGEAWTELAAIIDLYETNLGVFA